MNELVSICPICKSLLLCEKQAGPIKGEQTGFYYRCERCGDFGLGANALRMLQNAVRESEFVRSEVSHTVRKMGVRGDAPQIDIGLLQRIMEVEHPFPAEQARNLILFVGDRTMDIGFSTELNDASHGAFIGVRGPEALSFLIEQLRGQDLLTYKDLLGSGMVRGVRLTLKGWDSYHELKKRGIANARKAFMAMKYGDSEGDFIYRNYFCKAVKSAGFELERLDDNSKAGLIDDRLRVEIRSSAFLIADLTHGNQGAYWEAGFAEGLGKPVFYTCKESVFSDPARRPHFDTNHHYTVVWDEHNPDEAVNNLKAAIRATLPDLARMSDE